MSAFQHRRSRVGLLGVLVLVFTAVGPASAAPPRLTQFAAGTSKFAGGDAIARDASGRIWVALSNGVVARLSRSGRARTLARFSRDNPPTGIALDDDGNAWVAAPSFIARVTASGAVTRFTNGLTPGTMPYAITRGPDGNVWFTEYALAPDRYGFSGWGPGGIGRISPSGQITEFDQRQADGRAYRYISAGPDGALWFTEQNGIGRITTSGIATHFRNHLQPLAFGGITAGPHKRVWFTDDDVRSIGPDGKVTRYRLPLPPYTAVLSLTPGPGGTIWIAEQERPRFGRLSRHGRFREPAARLRRGTYADAVTATRQALYYVATDSDTGALFTGKLCLARSC